MLWRMHTLGPIFLKMIWIASIRRYGWADVSLSFEQVMYAALDARLGF
jgi:hypothetical protein